MIRVLNVVGKMHRAGQETILMNYYRAIDRTRVQFDFLVHTREECDYDREVLALGGRIFHVDKVTRGVLKYVDAIAKIVRENRYDCVHLHTAHAAGFLVLLAAKRGGARVRIAHSRNDMAELPLLHKLLVPVLCHYATDRFACSTNAGRWMFGARPFTVVRNAIPVERFRFSAEGRAQARARLGLGDELTIGHIGRFAPQKNHAFLLEVLAALKRRGANFAALLIGEGELLEECKRLAAERGLDDSVRFLGSRADIPELLWATDVFAFPSLYEGFGNVVTEAQAAGLPCVVSDAVTRETEMTPHIRYLPLSEGADRWAEAILEAGRAGGLARGEGIEMVRKAGFAIDTAAKWLEDFYLGKQGGSVQ